MSEVADVITAFIHTYTLIRAMDVAVRLLTATQPKIEQPQQQPQSPPPPSPPPPGEGNAYLWVSIMAKEYNYESWVYTNTSVSLCIDGSCTRAVAGDRFTVSSGKTVTLTAPLEGVYTPLAGSFEVRHRIVFDNKIELTIHGTFNVVASSSSNTFSYTFSSINPLGYDLTVYYRMAGAEVHDHIGYVTSGKPDLVKTFCNITKAPLYGFYNAPVYCKGVYVDTWYNICRDYM